MIEINEEGLEVEPIIAGEAPTSLIGSNNLDGEEHQGGEISLDGVDEHGGTGFMKFVAAGAAIAASSAVFSAPAAPSIDESVKDVARAQQEVFNTKEHVAVAMAERGMDARVLDIVSGWDAIRTFANKTLEDTFPPRPNDKEYGKESRETLNHALPILKQLQKETGLSPQKGENVLSYLARALAAKKLTVR